MYPTIDKKRTGMRIKKLMEMNRLTVKDIKNYLSLASLQAVYQWFDGTNIPSIDNLYALSELFQVPLDDIIAGSRRYVSRIDISILKEDILTSRGRRIQSYLYLLNKFKVS